MIHIIGANIAALVLNDQLSETSTKHNIIPIGNPGSGWAGLMRDGELLDLGQRYFELDFEASEKQPLAEYDENKSHRNFVHHVKYYITRHGWELEEAKIEAYFRGNIITCPLETTDLSDVMKFLTQSEKEAIIADISGRKPMPHLEMSRFGYDSVGETEMNLHDMISHNHGRTFNDLVIYPFVNKFGQNLKNVPMRMRRKLWAPIFFSNTILDFCNGLETYKPSRPHYKIKGHSTSRLVYQIAKAASGSRPDQQKVVEVKGGNFILDSGASIPSKDVFFGSSLEAIAGLLDTPLKLKKIKIRLIWFKVDASDALREIDYLSVMDAELPFTRVSCSSQSIDKSNKIYCVETFDLQGTVSGFFASLQKMGLISENCPMETLGDLSAPVLDEPTFENEENFNAKVKEIQSKLPDLDMRLANLTFGKNTFNDQALIALKMAGIFINAQNEYRK